MTTIKIPRKTIAILPFIVILICTACSNDSTVAQNTGETGTNNVDVDNRAQMAELGLQHDTAWELYQALVEGAGGGESLAWDNLPDWSGVYTRGRGGITFDPDQPQGGLPTAKLTPEFHERMLQKIAIADAGNDYDPISDCRPPGHPRWLTEPFLKEFVVTPDQTWLINEMVNDVRRVYTDGRGHTPEEDRYATWNGDSIGFWDGHRLILHTNELMAGQYQRRNPDYTDQVETVEIWEKIDEKNIEVDVWVYDPPALVEPWYTKQIYTKLTDPENRLRLRYWWCGENQNNVIVRTEEGGSQFGDFSFTEQEN